MPIYEYACRTCAHAFETLVRGGEEPDCPRCHGADLERALSTFAVGAPVASPRPNGPAASPCGQCGDPRGPGACSMN